MSTVINTAILKACLATGLVFSLVACGGSDESADAVNTAPAGQKTTQSANNPLASEQQLIRDAQGIQTVLDKDAEEKKKAIQAGN